MATAAAQPTFPTFTQQPAQTQMHHPTPAMHSSNGNSTSANALAEIFGSSSPPLQQGQVSQSGMIMLPGTPRPGYQQQQQQQQSPPPPAQPQGSFWATQSIAHSSTAQNRPMSMSVPQQHQQQQRAMQPQPTVAATAAVASTQGKDPFADLAGLF